jgi:hypothetical protein
VCTSFSFFRFHPSPDIYTCIASSSSRSRTNFFFFVHRETIREQQVIADEIATAISSNPLGEAIDEGDLETELENMEQEAIDVQMLNTGPVPVSVLPSAANGESKCLSITFSDFYFFLTPFSFFRFVPPSFF